MKHLIKFRDVIDKVYLNLKDPCESKCQYVIEQAVSCIEILLTYLNFLTDYSKLLLKCLENYYRLQQQKKNRFKNVEDYNKKITVLMILLK